MRTVLCLIRPLLVSSLLACLVLTGCSLFRAEDERDHDPEPLPPPLNQSPLATTSWDVCRLLGPKSERAGLYGSDLGFAAPLPASDRLGLLFGDTWSQAGDACQYPVTPADDLQASLPLVRPEAANAGPPSADAKAQACADFGVTLDDADDPKSWRRSRLFATQEDLDAGHALETGALRTPVAVWTANRTQPADAQLFALFHRGDLAPCSNSDECPQGMSCSNDAARGAIRLGQCTQAVALGSEPVPEVCRDDDDCGTGSSCDLDAGAICETDSPFTLEIEGQPISPPWYRDDARLGAAETLYVGKSVSPERPQDYVVVHRFVTRRFVNASARTVAYFDPDNPDANDYRPGDHTLLIWGRPAFVSKAGEQSLPFLLFVPLDELTDPEDPRWNPRFFAAYDSEGNPRWSELEQDAVPVYGTEAELQRDESGDQTLVFREPEFDYVNQMSVAYLEPLNRFVMFYGGDVAAWLVMDADGKVHDPIHPAPVPGAIHQRSARHPWGRARRDDPLEDGWTSAQAVLTRETAAPYLACGSGDEKLRGCTDESDQNSPLDLLATIAKHAADEPSDTFDVAAKCVEGSATLAAQTAVSGDPIGRLYGASLIEEWTADVSDQVVDLGPDERAVEVYWNVSTWNPYQVVLMKTQLRGVP